MAVINSHLCKYGLRVTIRWVLIFQRAVLSHINILLMSLNGCIASDGRAEVGLRGRRATTEMQRLK